MRLRLTAAVCLLLAMIPAAISVEELDSQRPWWRAVEIQRDLRLTAAQVARLDALFKRELPQRIRLHRQIQDLDVHLAHSIEHDKGDDSHVAQLSEQVEALRAAQNIRRTLMLFTMYQALTQEQRTLLAHMHRPGRGSPRRELSEPGSDSR
jgi:Spy/CpxP family protein refolding chaperone